ncbi:adaptin n terminal region domain-containing protein [Cystoisospora suis]|uniref:Adaptin n terminal region domain-containing protein n=1 Tax=Cystoisospora suis TaxID=483139 RepID=A0A2C6KCA4_9APIC|nr:adaptin n terminal region domain-containing protein [Cystoisospora suis]
MGTASLTELDGSQIVIAFVACQCTGGTSNEGAQSGSQKVENHDGNLASQEAGGCLQFRVNARSAGASCSQAICKQLCRLIEETAAGRLHVFTA